MLDLFDFVFELGVCGRAKSSSPSMAREWLVAQIRKVFREGLQYVIYYLIKVRIPYTEQMKVIINHEK